ncbi:MAG: DegT/DnrJ/EryC1/StrS family aminotransferase [Elusimicrobia bacterium]|nr:DegT/DnrJ/EryC1/StrS family aminotransferase [Elusimicrobiota bacterium]
MSKKTPKRKDLCVGDFRFSAKAKKYIAEIIKTNRVSYGPFSRRFEQAFAKAHDSRFAMFCNSGTSALHVALAALKERHGWADGDEVLVPAVTFVATSNIVFHNKMQPVFVDVDPLTYNIDPAKIEAKITSKTRAIIPVHLLGLPCDMDPILAIAKKHGLKIVEDSCETVFAKYKGKTVGSFGDFGCFSTYIAHYIVTGVGGFATTSDPELAVICRSLFNHGRDSIYIQIDDDKNATGAKLHEIAAKRFSFVSMGHSFRCTEFEAAIGLAQLEEKDAIIKARKGNAARLTKGLADLSDVLQPPTVPSDREHMFMMYPIVLRDRPKVELVNFLEDRGIETRDLMPLINQPIYRKLFGNLDAKYPVAAWINKGAFYIGCHQYYTPQDLQYVVDTIHEFFGR